MNIKSYPENLLETSWSQDRIYSKALYNPDSLIGCVPVVYGQIMRYHKFPTQGKGIIKKHESLPEDVNIDGFQYSYELMPAFLNAKSTDNEIFSVDTLLAHIAYAFKTNVAQGGGSPTKTDNIIEPLIEHFSYDRNIKRVGINDARMSLSRFSDILKDEVLKKRPVSVMIPGHAIICTGYNEKDKTFTFNYGWGDSPVNKYLENIDPDTLIYNIKPNISETLQLERVDYTGQNIFSPGDVGNISLKIRNISNNLYNGKVRLVLSDKFNYSQDILSSIIPININSNDSKNQQIDFKIPNEPSYGDLGLRIEYEGMDEEFRYITDENREIVTIDLKVTRRKASNVSFNTPPTIPDKFTLNQPYVVSVSLKTQGPIAGGLYANIVDSDNNIIRTVGFTQLSFSESGMYDVDIEVLIHDLKSQNEYYITFMIEEIHNENVLLNLVPDSENHAAYFKFNLLNDHLNYSNDVYLTESMDISEGLQYNGEYDLIVNYTITDKNSTVPHYINVNIVDEDGNIIFGGASTISPSWGIGAHKATVKVRTRGTIINDDLSCSLMISFTNILSQDTLLLSPNDENVYNPFNTIVKYRKLTDHVKLMKDLNVNKHQVNQGDELDINVTSMLNFSHGELAFICDYHVYVCDVNGNYTLIHEYTSSIENNIIQTMPLKVVIPDDLPVGKYKIYPAISFNRFYGYNDTIEETILTGDDSNVINYAVIDVI